MLNFHYVACISFGLLRSLSCEALGADWWSSNVWCATLLWNKVLFNNYISKNVLFFQSVHKITITIFHPSTSLYPPVRISLLIVGYYQIRWLLAFGEEVTRAVPRLSSSWRGRGSASSPERLARAGRADKMLMLLMLLTQAKQNKTSLHGSKPWLFVG